MAKALIKAIQKLVKSMIGIFFTPLNNLISQYLPDFTRIATAISVMFEYGTRCIGYLVDMLGIPIWAWSILITTYVSCSMISFLSMGIKRAVKWWSVLH